MTEIEHNRLIGNPQRHRHESRRKTETNLGALETQNNDGPGISSCGSTKERGLRSHNSKTVWSDTSSTGQVLISERE